MKGRHVKTEFPDKNYSRSWFLGVTLTAVAVAFLPFAWAGQEPKVNPLAPKVPVEQKREVAATAHSMTEADVEAFLDGVVPVQLERDDIAGAVVAVVKDGQVLFAKGYGYADVKNRRPVSADNTLFRPGSISKLFTWTAVMQLVEQGKLDLDHDVNEYLDFKIPATYPQPITLHDIMTHTSGFREVIMNLFVPDVKDLVPLNSYLPAHIPKRIFPPGVTPAYSNYATALAGYIVQRVSGQPFDDYINQNIFQPLNMQHTTFAQPLPENLKPLMSNGYRVASSEPGKFEIVQAWPAGSVSTSAMDMTHFILAHLQNGEYHIDEKPGARILRPETVEKMHSRQFAPHPEMNAMALGFYEETRNGHRIIGHGGDTIYFHSDLHLVQDAGLGFFVSYNSAGKGSGIGRAELWEKFLDRYFPYTPPAEPTVSSASQDARTVSGLYMSSRRAQDDILGATSMLGEARVFTNRDGTVSVDAIKGFDGQPRKFREIGPLVYREVDGQDRLAFTRDAGGRLYFAMDYPFMIFQRVGGLQGKPFNHLVLFAGVLVLVLTLILWPVSAIVRRHYGRKLIMSPKERRLRLAVRLICAVDLIFLGVLIALLSSLNSPGALNSHLDPWIHLLQVVGLIGTVGTLVVVYNAVRAWRPAGQPEWIWGKVSETVIALACIGLAWFFIYWSLLNFNLNF